jgi:Alginate export
LIGISNWTNAARSFDGYRAMVQSGRFRLDAFAASVVVLRNGEVGEHTPGNHIDGLYGQLRDVVPHSTIQPYFLWRRSLSLKLENSQLGNEHFGTTGFRWVGKLPLGLDFNTETAIQRGSLGTNGLAAWAALAAVGYKIPVAALKLSHYFIEYNFASGDGNSKGGHHGMFDQLYPSGRNKLDLADQVGWKNIQHLRTGPEWKLAKRISGSFKYSDYWLANAHDALYNSRGNVVGRQVNGTAGRWVGQELDGMTSYSASEKSEIGAGFGYLLPGTFLKMTTPGHSYSYPYIYYSTAF